MVSVVQIMNIIQQELNVLLLLYQIVLDKMVFNVHNVLLVLIHSIDVVLMKFGNNQLINVFL